MTRFGRWNELGALGGGGALFVAMYAARVGYAREGLFGFLLWNLFLAGVPWLAALALARALRRGALAWSLALGAIWLLFLPNAPYVVTDLVHLRARPPVPLWYDAILLGAAAALGLLSGAFSLRRVHRGVAEAFGPRAGLATVALALPAAGFGIYLGRFARLNSWDVVLHPRAVLLEVLAAPSPRALVVTAATASLLAVVTFAVGPGAADQSSSADKPYCSR